MESASYANELTDLSVWNATDNTVLNYPDEFLDSTSAFADERTSCSSTFGSSTAFEDFPSFPSSYISLYGGGNSPEDIISRYETPFSAEDEAAIDPDNFVSKEVSSQHGHATVEYPGVLIQKQRRREQNRLAQRAFRERKEGKLKQLEKHIEKIKSEQRQLERRYQNLRTAHLRLQSGLKILLEASGTFDGVDIMATNCHDAVRG